MDAVRFGGFVVYPAALASATTDEKVAHGLADSVLKMYDSVPETEYEETVNKATALFRAVDFAEKGLES